MSLPDDWSRNAKEYARFGHAWARPFARKAVDLGLTCCSSHSSSLTPPHPPHHHQQKYLDVACGTGAVTEVLASSSSSQQCSILATDYAQGMVEYMNETIIEQKWKNVEAKVMDATDMSLSTDSVHIAWCLFGLAFFPNAGISALEEIRRVLVTSSSSSTTTAIAATTTSLPLSSDLDHRNTTNNSYCCHGQLISATWAHHDLVELILQSIQQLDTSTYPVIVRQPPVLVKQLGWTELGYNIFQFQSAGFEKVEGKIVSVIKRVYDLDQYLEMTMRNPGLKKLFNGWGIEKIERFKKGTTKLVKEFYEKVERGEVDDDEERKNCEEWKDDDDIEDEDVGDDSGEGKRKGGYPVLVKANLVRGWKS